MTVSIGALVRGQEQVPEGEKNLNENNPESEFRIRLSGASTNQLIEVLVPKHQHLTARSVALELLMQSIETKAGSRAIEAVSDIIRFEDKHSGLRVAAIRLVGLRRVNDVDVIDALVHALRDKAKRIRRLAADALGEIGDASALEALLTILSQDELDTETRSAVVSALGKFQISRSHSSRVMAVLIGVLENKGHAEVVRANAAWNLAGFKHYDVVNALEQVAESEDDMHSVRAAIRALARLAGEVSQERPEAFSNLQPSSSYILDPSIHGPDWADVEERFRRYRHYLESIRERLPTGAREYALGPYHNCGSRECPHDSWLEDLSIEAHSTGDRSQYRALDIQVRLLGSYHDGYIEFHYRNVHDYLLTAGGDWMSTKCA